MTMSAKPAPLPRETSFGDDTDASLYPLLSVDTVIFTVVDTALCVLLVKRARVPGKEVSYP